LSEQRNDSVAGACGKEEGRLQAACQQQITLVGRELVEQNSVE
jgi:hypothetical protein